MNDDEITKIVNKKLDYWKKKLIDLSKRNNLVSYRFTKSKSLKVISPKLKQLVEDLNKEGKIQFLSEESNSVGAQEWMFSEEEKTVAKKLYRLYLTAKNNFQELGVNTLFIGLYSFKYKDSKDSEIERSAPIFLYPIEIEKATVTKKKYHSYLISSESGDLQLNPALVEKLSHEYNVTLKEYVGEDFEGYLSYLKEVTAGIDGGKISEEAFIDIFSYQKYIMYQDLIKNEKYAYKSDLVRAYVGDRNALQDEIAESMREDFDDSSSPDVLPADSSQKRAIELAKSGVTFVLQGPPGTGKSQTIVNIIAALIQQKKKILFVSQKMAALNVVQKRLDEVGLGRYCLNLHTYQGNKKEVITQLMRELETSPKIDDKALTYDFKNYLNSQRELNEYYDYLCKKRAPYGYSLYEVKGEIAKLVNYDSELINMSFKRVLEFDKQKISEEKSKIQRIQGIITQVNDPLNTVLYNYEQKYNTPIEKPKFKQLVDNIDISLKNLNLFIEKLKDCCKISLSDLKQIELLLVPESFLKKYKVFEYLHTDNFNDEVKILSNFYKILKERDELKDELNVYVSEKFIYDDLIKHEQALSNTKLLSRLFNSDYKNSIHDLSQYANKKLGHNDWIKTFELKQKVLKVETNISKNTNKRISSIEGYLKTKVIENILDQAKEIDKINTIFDNLNGKKFTKFLQVISASDNNTLYTELSNDLKKISKYVENVIEKEFEINKISKFVRDIKSNFSKLNEILLFKEEFAKLDDELRSFIKGFIDAKLFTNLIEYFEKKYYLSVYEQILSKDNKMAPKDLVDYIRDNDFDVRNNFRFQIMDAIEKEQPSLGFSSVGSNEVYVLKRESQKKRRLKPVRDLLEAIPNLVFSLKPCFMMSPLSVSQYINPNSIKFDVVIFDEASQIMPEDAVPCLIRAKQTIIMGDTQQLPPTSFFMTNEDEFEDEELEDLDSFLSEASTKFREKLLEWHYRSNDEHLIAFSNRFFYENRLITFPNSIQEKDDGLEFVYLKSGIYDRGKSRKNTQEAKKVVDIYQEISKTEKDKSIGIIAFSMAQENAIREAFIARGIRIDESVEFSNEELFIKNLETVQGDERDIIIISVGYGKDSQGKFSYNFGPINKPGGYKRLNVAITRSRYRTIVVSSILPEDLDEDKINTDGLRHLKNYIDYSKNKDFDKFVTGTEHLNFDSSFEEAVYDALVKEGYEVSCQVGCSGYKVDLAIKHPKRKGEYLIGVECDGAQYHSSRFARDRDKIRQAVLERLGWNIHRIWSDDWLNNKDYELTKIKNKFDALVKIKGKNNPTPKQDKFEQIEEVIDFQEVNLKEQYPSYKIADLPTTRTKLEFDGYGDLSWGGDKAKEIMIKVLEIESPIEKELLYKRTLETFGIQKLGARLRRTFDDLLKELKKEYSNIFIYQDTVSIGQIEKTSHIRISNESNRPFILIPKEELAGAIVEILKNTFSTDGESLIKEVARNIYGNNRTGTKIDKKMKEAIIYAIKENIIKMQGDKFVISK